MRVSMRVMFSFTRVSTRPRALLAKMSQDEYRHDYACQSYHHPAMDPRRAKQLPEGSSAPLFRAVEFRHAAIAESLLIVHDFFSNSCNLLTISVDSDPL